MAKNGNNAAVESIVWLVAFQAKMLHLISGPWIAIV
jgi:hypothetical protein